MRVNPIAAVLTFLALWLFPAAAALAQNMAAPTPRVVIYPGDVIRDDMLADLPTNVAKGPDQFAETRSAVLGKISHRTLLPGAPIPLAGLDSPRLVANGSPVRLIFVEGGLTIATMGAAMQDGSVGDVIKVRNSDSGVTVMGAVQSDGTVRVSG